MSLRFGWQCLFACLTVTLYTCHCAWLTGSVCVFDCNLVHMSLRFGWQCLFACLTLTLYTCHCALVDSACLHRHSVPCSSQLWLTGGQGQWRSRNRCFGRWVTSIIINHYSRVRSSSRAVHCVMPGSKTKPRKAHGTCWSNECSHGIYYVLCSARFS